MTNQQNNSFNDQEYYITPSLLNSWGYIWECEKFVRESQNDNISFEDKVAVVKEKAFNDFLNVLKKVKTEPNEYMLRGIEFEEECYKGNQEQISPIIENGVFQIVGTKKINVNGFKILMYGKLDVLKGGVIYDIKRVSQYTIQKYFNSYQHGFYLDLFSNAKRFKYLAYDDKDKLHQENYFRDEYTPTIDVISNFLKWLEEHELLDVYKEYWKSKGEN